MSGSPNRYLTEPRLFELSAKLAKIEPLQRQGWSIACQETIFRPAGGGQPEDHGTIEVDGVEHQVRGFHKAHGLTYLHLPDLLVEPRRGASVIQRIMGERRDRLSRLHTLQHMFSAESARAVPMAIPAGSGLDDAAPSGWIRLKTPTPVCDQELAKIDRAVRSNVSAEAQVFVTTAKSSDEAKMRYSDIFRCDPTVELTGKIRLVVIEWIDANPCAGTHWETSNVGPYEMNFSRSTDGADHIVTVTFNLLSA